MNASSVVLQRVRVSGRCPLSLLSDDRIYQIDNFDVEVLNVLGPVGCALRSDEDVMGNFLSLLQRVESVGALPVTIPPESRRRVLEYRRAILLTIVGATSSDSPTLSSITVTFMTAVKAWLDDALANATESVDLLLHLLSSIQHLPVTKNSIKDSGLGKAVGTVEKHRVCKGSPHGTAIIQRVEQIKQAWHARVKSQKIQETTSDASGAKRSSENEGTSPSATKKLKQTTTVDEKKVSSFSSLLKKVSASPPVAQAGNVPVTNGNKPTAGTDGADKTTKSNLVSTTISKKEKKPGRRVKWADHFGGKIETAHDDEGDEIETHQSADTNNVSWSDRKKRDRLREKELLSKAKKAKLVDDGDDDGLDLVKTMKPTVSWSVPPLLPDRPDITKPQLESTEVLTENYRMKSVTPANYASENDVPISPHLLSDSEQSLVTSQNSVIVASIPFFVPQVPPTPEAAPAPAPLPVPVTTTTAYQAAPQSYVANNTYSITPSPQYDGGATAEFVQSLGLPLFLVGQSRSALQTLAGSPGLLSTLVDASGMYDQPRLMNLVQTLSASTGSPHVAPPVYQPPVSTYNAPAVATSKIGGKSTSYTTSTGTRLVIDKSVEGNLHVSGYGPGTTEAELIASFSPYVKVDEVVMKGTFAFINTSDPPSAARAREALHGTLIGGMPIKINQATRKQKDPMATATGTYGTGHNSMRSNTMSSYGNQLPTTLTPKAPASTPIPSVPRPMLPYGIADVDAVRDDRGNPATKNLFIAGYGPSTTEEELRDLVSQYVVVVGVILKGTFSFVNTTDRESAVYAREMLGGTMLNGGVVRINFAKETGRLGTSFDLTYGPNTGPNANRVPNPTARPVQTGNMSYYGRGGRF